MKAEHAGTPVAHSSEPTAKPDIRINGIASLIYGVEDVDESTRFFVDFGLSLEKRCPDHAVFRLPDGATIELRRHDDPALPTTTMAGIGVRRVVWGLDSQDMLDWLVDDLSTDHVVERDGAGTAWFKTGFGISMGIRLWHKRPVFGAPLPANSVGNIARMNAPRRWRERAYPKAINHVVFAIPDFVEGTAFMLERLGFRLSDEQMGFGRYLRAGGSFGHHTILFLNAHAPLPGMDGAFRFHHVNFAVDDIDEIMVGANHMTRLGWPASHLGLGRHRVDSALFYYLDCPAGGEAEYGADGDCVDDAWIPRQWPAPLFAFSHWVHHLPEFLNEPPPWRINYLTDHAERFTAQEGRSS